MLIQPQSFEVNPMMIDQGGYTYLSASSVSFSVGSYGSWVQASASLSETLWLWGLTVENNSTGNLYSMLVEVGIGGSGSESAIAVIGLASPIDNYRSVFGLWPFPVKMPSGSRVAVRGQHRTGSTHSVPLINLLCFKDSHWVSRT